MVYMFYILYTKVVFTAYGEFIVTFKHTVYFIICDTLSHCQRQDVPWYLKLLNPHKEVGSLVFMEDIFCLYSVSEWACERVSHWNKEDLIMRIFVI